MKPWCIPKRNEAWKIQLFLFNYPRFMEDDHRRLATTKIKGMMASMICSSCIVISFVYDYEYIACCVWHCIHPLVQLITRYSVQPSNALHLHACYYDMILNFGWHEKQHLYPSAVWSCNRFRHTTLISHDPSIEVLSQQPRCRYDPCSPIIIFFNEITMRLPSWFDGCALVWLGNGLVYDPCQCAVIPMCSINSTTVFG